MHKKNFPVEQDLFNLAFELENILDNSEVSSDTAVHKIEQICKDAQCDNIYLGTLDDFYFLLKGLKKERVVKYFYETIKRNLLKSPVDEKILLGLVKYSLDIRDDIAKSMLLDWVYSNGHVNLDFIKCQDYGSAVYPLGVYIVELMKTCNIKSTPFRFFIDVAKNTVNPYIISRCILGAYFHSGGNYRSIREIAEDCNKRVKEFQVHQKPQKDNSLKKKPVLTDYDQMRLF